MNIPNPKPQPQKNDKLKQKQRNEQENIYELLHANYHYYIISAYNIKQESQK